MKKTTTLFFILFLTVNNLFSQSTDKSISNHPTTYTKSDSIEKENRLFHNGRFITQIFHYTINYPLDAIEERITGNVVLHYKINKEGYIDSVRVFKSLYPSCDKEAIRVILSQPKISKLGKYSYFIDTTYETSVKFSINGICDESLNKIELPTELKKVNKYIHKNKFIEAAEYLNKLLIKSPNNIDYISYKGLVYYSAGNIQKGCSLFNEAIEIGNRNGFSINTTFDGMKKVIDKYCQSE